MPGQLLLLFGENLTAYMVWDGMRAIDYLLTRPEVDRERSAARDTPAAAHSRCSSARSTSASAAPW